MSDKFKNIPVDPDTKITYRGKYKLGEYDVLYEKWIWDGVCGESVIFEEGDVSEVDDEAIISLVSSSSICNKRSDITVKRSDSGYVFTNFNFNVR